MSLRVIDPDPAAVAAARDQLPRLVGSPTLGRRGAALAASTDVALALPHRVYALGLTQLVDGDRLAAAVVVAQQFLLVDGPEAVATVEVRDPAEGIQLGGGPFPQVLAAAVERAEQQPALDAAEVRLLRVSALHFSALWLHAPAAGNDTLVPLDDPPGPAVADRYYDADVLLDLLAASARELRGGDDGERGG